MSARSTHHATFFVERTYPAKPERVFAAFADPAIKSQWFGGPEGDGKTPYQLDFRIGGREINEGGPEGGPTYRYEAIYQDIVPNERIISTYEMYLDGQRISVSIATTELLADGNGTKLKFTEQAVFLDGLDKASDREAGTKMLLDGLGNWLSQNNSE
ncbi:polyketide cyclase [bacterium]|nr:MAG: polyketide cyclase [bacterium]